MTTRNTTYTPEELQEHARHAVETPQKLTSQAERIIARFGGARKMARSIAQAFPECALAPSTIYRWTYPISKKGSGGVIPACSMPLVLGTARHEGIWLSADDLDPRPRPGKGAK